MIAFTWRKCVGDEFVLMLRVFCFTVNKQNYTGLFVFSSMTVAEIKK